MKKINIRASESALSRRLRSGLPGCLSAAALLSLSSLMSLNAAIIYSGVQNLDTRVSWTGEPVSDSRGVNLDGQGELEFFMRSHITFQSAGHSLNINTGTPWTPSGMPFDAVTVQPIGPGLFLSILGADTLINSDSVFPTNRSLVIVNWPNGTDAYFGFRLKPPDSQVLYGWGRLQVTSVMSPGSGSGGMTLVEWAYEDTGSPILAGQVPEPRTAVFLAGAALTGAALRRRSGGAKGASSGPMD